jgi:hypothetical protein
METSNMEFTVDYFEPSSVGENRLKKMILDAMRSVYPESVDRGRT